MASRRRAFDPIGVALLVVPLVTPAVATGQTSGQPATPPAELRAGRASAPPVIDGDVLDAEWSGAAVANSFIQYEPQRGAPSSVRSQALLLHDAVNLYVAYRAWDSDPITAQLTRRDAELLRDDAVVLVLDTTLDRRSGYYFITNALGTQADGRIADDGRSADSSWDAPWQSAVRRTDYGWSAEFKIPLSSIRYAAGDNRTWGVNFGRSRRRTLELSFWSGPLDHQWRVSQAGRLAGLTVPPPIDRLQVVPYGLARLQEGTTSDWDAGIDARYALTPTTAIYGTVFPDFATIEADQEQVNLTRFEVSLREKRQFFLEGQELFSQRIRTFYSRRIADIDAGGKLLGKQGPWTTAFLTTGGELTGTERHAQYTVARVQRDVYGRSTVAAMGAARRHNGLTEGSVSLDTNLFFSRTVGMTAQVVRSFGRFDRGATAFLLRPSYDSSTGHFHVRYTHLGDRLADNLNAIGFVTDDDRREIDSAVNKTYWIRSGRFERIQYDSNYNTYWGQTGILRSWKIDESVDVEFRNKISTNLAWSEEYKLFEKGFRNRKVQVEVGYNTREYSSVRAGVEFGRNFDADFVLWTASARRKLTPALSAEYSLERLVLRPDPERDSTWIHVLRADQFFTKDLFLRVFFQTNSAIDRRNLQAVFVYRYWPPFGSLQVAYQRGTAAFGQRSTQGDTLFVKATTVF